MTAAEAAKAVADILEQVALENRRKVLEAQESLVDMPPKSPVSSDSSRPNFSMWSR